MSATPILDLEQEPPKLPGVWRSRIIGALIGFSILPVLILRDKGMLPDWHFPGFNGLLIIPGLYLAIAIHEMGHLVTGLLVGLESGGLAIGGFTFLKSGRNWVFRFNPRMWTGGFYKPLIRTPGFRLSRYGWMVAGGPFASFLLTAVCYWASVHEMSNRWNWIGTTFWCSLFIACITLVPFSSGVNKSDGARLLMLMLHPERATAFLALLELQTAETDGVRPREWDPLVYSEMLDVDGSSNEYPYCQLLAYYRRLDEGQEEEALAHLEKVLATSFRSGKPWTHLAYLEAAYASAIVRCRASQARTWKERACRLRKPESLHVVDAGIATCEGRYEEALRSWEAARQRVVRRRLDSGVVRFAVDRWSESEALCRTALIQS